MIPPPPIHRRRAPAAGAAMAFALCACATPYELREFRLSDQKEPWGRMFVGVQSKGNWKEGRLAVEGTPYRINFAASLIEAPAPDCALFVANVTITTRTGGPPIVNIPRLDLQAGPPRPTEPNWRAHSAHFYFVPLSQVYVTSRALEPADLPYVPLTLSFDLQGGPACPAALHAPIHYDWVMKPHVWKGESGPLPMV